MSLSTLLYDTVNFKSNTQFLNAIFHSNAAFQSRRDSIKIVYCNVKRIQTYIRTAEIRIFINRFLRLIIKISNPPTVLGDAYYVMIDNTYIIPHNLWYF